MKTSSISLFGALALATCLCSCGSMQPDDKLQKVVSGDIFGGHPVDMKQEKLHEDNAREQYLSMPADHYSVDKETEDGSGKVGLRMPL